MAASSKFTASYAGIGEMLRSEEMQAEMRRRAEKVAQHAEANAPTGSPDDDPHAGRYKSSFQVSSGVQRRKTSRAYGEVINVAPEAVIVEYGTSQQEAHHTLGHALDAARD